jgi:hypothetical protein
MRKQHLIFLLVFLLAMSVKYSSAQFSNLVFFTEGGERFYLLMNGVRQNASSETNIQVTQIPSSTCKIKIKFEDPSLPPIEKTMMFKQGMETTFLIRRNNQGDYVVRFMNQSEIEEAPRTIPSVTYRLKEIIQDHQGGGQGKEHHTKPPYVMPGYSGPVGCPYPMTELDFRDVKASISSKSFEDSKLTIAKEVISATCMFASEVKEIMELFTYESTRLEFAKFAYAYTFDLGNYYKVNSAFQFESSIDELNKYLKSQQK